MGVNNMTEAEVKLADERLRAEVARLIAETRQISVGTFLVPFLAAAGLMGATAVVANGKRSFRIVFLRFRIKFRRIP